MSKLDAQRRLIPNAVFLFLASCIGFERCPDVPFVELSVQIIERTRMVSHRAKDGRNQEIPAHKRERGSVAGFHDVYFFLAIIWELYLCVANC